MKRLIIIFAILLIAGSAWAVDYYVATDGSGTTCTNGTECTLAYAMTQADDGDIVYLEGSSGPSNPSVYTTTIIPTNIGSDGSPITFMIEPGETAYSAEITVVSSYGANLAAKDWIVIDGLYFNTTLSNWIFFDDSQHNIVQNCKFYNANTGDGIIIRDDSSDNQILDNEFPNAPVRTIGTIAGWCIAKSDGYWWDSTCDTAYEAGTALPSDCDCLTAPSDAISIASGDRNIISGNTIGDVDHSAIEYDSRSYSQWGDAGELADYSVIRGNTVTNRLHTGMSIIDHGTEVHVLAESNLVYDSGLNYDSNPNPSSRGSRPLNSPALYMFSDNTIARYNVADSNGMGIHFGANAESSAYDMSVYHNTVFDNVYNVNHTGNSLYYYGDNLLINNLCISPQTREWSNIADPPGYVISNLFDSNLFTSGSSTFRFKANSSVLKTLATLKSSFPLEWGAANTDGSADFTDSDNRDFTLGSGSAAINSGRFLAYVKARCVGVDDPHGDCTADNEILLYTDADCTDVGEGIGAATIPPCTGSGTGFLGAVPGKMFFTGAGAPWSIAGETADTIYDDDGSSTLIVSVSGNILTVVDNDDFAAADGITTVQYYHGFPDIGAFERETDPPDDDPIPADVGNDFSNETHAKALWRFEDGALATDSKGSYTLTNNNTIVSSTADKMEGDASAVFDGVNQTFSRAGTTSDFGWAASGEFTIGTWFKADTSTVLMHYIKKYATNKRCIRMSFGIDSKLYFGLGYNNGDSIEYTSFSNALTDTNWYYIAHGYEATGRTYYIRIINENLSLFQHLTGTMSEVWAGQAEDAAIEIGGDLSNYFDGHLDETVVFDSKLSTDDIDMIAAQTYPGATITDVHLTSTPDENCVSTEITDPTTYTQEQVAHFAVTSDGTFKINDGDGAWSTVSLTLEGSQVANYVCGGESSKLIFGYTVERGDDDADLDLSGTDALSSGDSTIKNSGGQEFTLTLPTADLGGIVTFDTSGDEVSVSFPGDYATWAAFEAEFPNLVPNDFVETFVNENITLDADDDGTNGNPIRIIWRPTVIGKTLNLNNNEYVWALVPPGTTVTNDGGTGTTWNYFNGAAGL